MKILTCTARAVSVPVSQPTSISTRLLAQREYVIVEIATADDPLTGVGYTYAGTSGGRLLAQAVNELLEPVVVGSDASGILELWDRMYQETLLLGRRGAVLRAISAVDIALWDLAAKKAGLPLAVLLGGSTCPVPAYASGGYYRPNAGDPTRAVEEEIARNIELGFTHHKIKVGGLSIEADARRVRAGTAALGADGKLALDANNAYRTRPEALEALRAFEVAAGDRRLWWFEEPLSADDVDGHAALARATDTPIATGELAQTRWEFQQLLSARSADILQPDAGVLGGVSEWLRVARTAESFGVPVFPHWHANLHVHLAAATSNCPFIEHFEFEKDIYNFEALVHADKRLVCRAGEAHIPPEPGIGVAFDEESIARFLISA